MTFAKAGPVLRRGAGVAARVVRAGAREGVRRFLPSPPTIESVPEGRFVDLPGRGRTFVVEVPGPTPDAPVVVLLHALGCTAYLSWVATLGELSKRYRVVTFDQRWHGRGIRSERFRFTDCADDVVGVMDALGVERACVVGHDIGGGIAQMMALRWPQRVSALVLVDSVAYDAWPQREVKMARAMLPLTRHLPATFLLSVLRTDLARGYADGPHGAHAIERYVKPFASPEGRDAFFEHLLALDPRDTAALAPRLADIVAPTSIVWGAHDPFLPLSIAERLARDVPRSTLDVISDGRHFVPEEHAERVAAAITAVAPRDD